MHRISLTHALRLAALAPIAVATLARCTSSPSLGAGDALTVGTWGGENAGVVVSDSSAHVHVGCTNGSFPIAQAVSGQFDIAGSYILRAYPVAIGPELPARFTGVVRNGTLTLTVTVDDTVAHTPVVLGPVRVTLGKEPRMGPCPICKTPGDAR